MQYMLLFLETEKEFAQRAAADPGSYWGGWNDYIGALAQAGVVVSGAGLEPPHTGTTVRLRDGKRIVEDGPFAETKESLGGFFVIDVPDLDTALDWAARAPCAGYASVEVRPVMKAPAKPGEA